MRDLTLTEKRKMLKNLNSLYLCLVVHPHNEPDSEFADRIFDIEEMIEVLEKNLLNI